MNINIGKYIYSALLAIDALQHVFPVIADFNDAVPPTPFAVYQRTSAEPNYTKSLWTGEITHHYSVTIAAANYADTVTVAQSAIDAILALSHTDKDDIRFAQCTMTDISEDYLEGLFLQTIQFEINTLKK